MTNKEYNHYLSQFYEILDISSGCDMDNIRECFCTDITNDTKDFIDVNYKDILVTFEAIKGLGSHYDRYGGKARLTDKFEAYDEDGGFVGLFSIYHCVPDNDEEFVEDYD